MSNQDGLGLAAQTVDAVGEHAAQIIGAVVELADRNGAAHARIRFAGRRHSRHGHRLGALGGASRNHRRQECQRPDLHDLVQHHLLQPTPVANARGSMCRH
ncbi:hypothetical protein D3C72_2195750 [compost metagenome]